MADYFQPATNLENFTAAVANTPAPGAPAPTPTQPAQLSPTATPGIVSAPSQTQSIDVTSLGQPTLSASQLPTPSSYTPSPVPDLSAITAQADAPTASQGQYDDITKQIGDLTGQLSGQSDYANSLQAQYNVPQLTSTANDITANIANIQQQRDTLQQQLKNQYGNDASKGYLAFEQQSADSTLAAKQSAYASTLATINGQLSTAQSYIAQAIKNKYDPITSQISALTTQAGLVGNTLSREDSKKLAVMQAELADRSAQIAANKAISTTMLEKIAVAAANPGKPAPAYVVSQAQNAALSDNPASTLAIIAPYLNDPLAAQKEIAEIGAEHASAASSLANADESNANAAKIRATTPNPATGQGYDALSIRRYTLASNAIVKNYLDNPGYKLVTQGAPYLGKINAAINTPGSVSDQDLLDSITKLNQGGSGQVTEAQVNTILKGASLSDKLNTWTKQLGQGGVLSNDQRQQIQKLAQATFDSYKKLYQPVYKAATSQLKDAGIPKAFWTIPDSVTLANQAMGDNGTSGIPDPAAVQAATPPGQIAITRNGVPGYITPEEFDADTDTKL